MASARLPANGLDVVRDGANECRESRATAEAPPSLLPLVSPPGPAFVARRAAERARRRDTTATATSAAPAATTAPAAMPAMAPTPRPALAPAPGPGAVVAGLLEGATTAAATGGAAAPATALEAAEAASAVMSAASASAPYRAAADAATRLRMLLVSAAPSEAADVASAASAATGESAKLTVELPLPGDGDTPPDGSSAEIPICRAKPLTLQSAPALTAASSHALGSATLPPLLPCSRRPAAGMGDADGSARPMMPALVHATVAPAARSCSFAASASAMAAQKILATRRVVAADSLHPSPLLSSICSRRRAAELLDTVPFSGADALTVSPSDAVTRAAPLATRDGVDEALRVALALRDRVALAERVAGPLPLLVADADADGASERDAVAGVEPDADAAAD